MKEKERAKDRGRSSDLQAQESEPDVQDVWHSWSIGSDPYVLVQLAEFGPQCIVMFSLLSLPGGRQVFDAGLSRSKEKTVRGNGPSGPEEWAVRGNGLLAQR